MNYIAFEVIALFQTILPPLTPTLQLLLFAAITNYEPFALTSVSRSISVIRVLSIGLFPSVQDT